MNKISIFIIANLLVLFLPVISFAGHNDNGQGHISHGNGNGYGHYGEASGAGSRTEPFYFTIDWSNVK